MKRSLFLLTFVPFFLHARPMEIMNQRLNAYKDLNSVECGDPNFRKSSHALKMGLECTYKCINNSPATTQLSAVFSPEEIGLNPGNGSQSDKIIWSSLNVGLKTWSEKQCLDAAIQGCKSLSSIEDVSLSQISSGEWKIKAFPKCNEKSVTISPFDSKARAEQFYSIAGNLVRRIHSFEGPHETSSDYTFKVPGLEMSLPINDDESKKCERKIIGNICYGDCIDMNSKGDTLTETLATPEPLGRETLSICADEIYARLKNEKISASSKQLICENYYWTTVMKGRVSVKTCAAVRGDVDCSQVIR